jgi:hypothetical protein
MQRIYELLVLTNKGSIDRLFTSEAKRDFTGANRELWYMFFALFASKRQEEIAEEVQKSGKTMLRLTRYILVLTIINVSVFLWSIFK